MYSDSLRTENLTKMGKSLILRTYKELLSKQKTKLSHEKKVKLRRGKNLRWS